MTSPSVPTVLQLVRGELRVLHWPAAQRPPFGLQASAGLLLGPPRLRRRVRQQLAAIGHPFDDTIAPPALDADERPPAPTPPPAPFTAWCHNDQLGLLVGAAETARIDLLLAAAHHTRARTLLLVRDSGAVARWEDALEERGFDPAPDDARPSPLAVVTAADAATTMHWRARRHDLLVVDRPEQMPSPALQAALDGSAALHRLGFVDAAGQRRLAEWSAGLGSVLAIAAPHTAPALLQLHLPLTADERAGYEAAWHTFLGAFDAYVATQPQAGFGTFVQQARRDPTWRPALAAWHQALRIASWNAAKADATATLLARHRGERTLVFAPDRASTYALSLAHLIAPVTAELPLAERRATLAAFAAGRLHALVGPRLLDLGVPERTAQVGILVGGGFGAAQRAARLGRIATTGVVYELVAQETIEVGRAARSAAGAGNPASGPCHD